MSRGLIYFLIILVLLVGYYLFRTYRAERNIEQQLTEISDAPATPFRLSYGSVDVSPLSGNLSISDLGIGSKIHSENAFHSANTTFEIGYSHFMGIYLWGLESEMSEIKSGTIVFDDLSIGDTDKPWATINRLTLTQYGELAENIRELLENQWVQNTHSVQIALDRINIDTSHAPSSLSKWLILKPADLDTAGFHLDKIDLDMELLPTQTELSVNELSGRRQEMKFQMDGYFNYEEDSLQITNPSSFSANLDLTGDSASFYRLSYGPSPEYDYIDLKGVQIDGTINKDFNKSSSSELPPGIISLNADSARWPIPETIVSNYRSFLTLAGWQGEPIPLSDLQIHYLHNEESNTIQLDPVAVSTALGEIRLSGTLIPFRNGERYRWIDTKLTIRDIEPGLQNMVNMAERMFQLQIPINNDSLSLKLNGSPYSPSVSF